MKKKKEIRFSLSVIALYSKYTLLVSSEDEKSEKITKTNQRILRSGLKVYNAMVMNCSSKMTNNSEFAKRFIWTRKTRISKFVIPISKIVCIGKLPDIIDQ